MTPLSPWERVTDQIASMVAVGGLDLAAPMDIARYNAAVEESYAVPMFERESALGIVIGNTRALWPCFLAALEEDAELLASADPLDTYVERVVRDAVAFVPFATEVRFSHEPRPRLVAMQRLADLAGLAWLSPAHLSVHPIFGPWIALRALVIVDLEGPPETEGPKACAECESACVPMLERALASNGLDDWIALRAACPIGREHRYSDEQVRYHYEKDRAVLRGLVGTKPDQGTPAD